MPRSWKISTYFVTLINRLGIRPPPALGWTISDEIVPVTIVDSDITLATSSATALLDTDFTAGDLAAPVAGTVIADTGAQPAGNYFAIIQCGADFGGGAVGSCRIQRRDAANAATLWDMLYGQHNVQDSIFVQLHIALAVNERLRVIVGPTAYTAGSTVRGSIFLIPG
jgi:hypothetical protein